MQNVALTIEKKLPSKKKVQVSPYPWQKKRAALGEMPGLGNQLFQNISNPFELVSYLYRNKYVAILSKDLNIVAQGCAKNLLAQ